MALSSGKLFAGALFAGLLLGVQPQSSAAQGNIVYDPRYHTFESWASLMCEANANHGLISDVVEDNWLEWAEQFINVTDIAKDGAISPSIFVTWDGWATALLNVAQ